MLTIPIGHTLGVMHDVFGGFAEVMATTSTRRPHAKISDTGETTLNTSSDQIVIAGSLISGLVASIHYRGGLGATDGD